MIGSVPHLVAAVRNALATKVLPELSQQTWTAANIRSSISILTYVETALRLQRPFLIDSAMQYRRLLETTLTSTGGWLEPPLRARIEALLAETSAQPAYVETSVLADQSLHYREVMTSVIRSSAAARREGRDADFHRMLQAALADINEREFEINKPASQLPPF